MHENDVLTDTMRTLPSAILGLTIVLALLIVLRGVYAVWQMNREQKQFRRLARLLGVASSAQLRAMSAEGEANMQAEKSQQKTRFVSVISHEVRNPLTGVILNADNLIATDLDEQQRE